MLCLVRLHIDIMELTIDMNHIRDRHVKKVKDLRTTRFLPFPAGFSTVEDIILATVENPDSTCFKGHRDFRQVIQFEKHFYEPVGTRWKDSYFRRTESLFSVVVLGLDSGHSSRHPFRVLTSYPNILSTMSKREREDILRQA